MFDSEICGRNTRQFKNFHQQISNLSLYQTGILNSGIKIYNNLPPFLKRTSYNSKEFKSLARNFLYSNPVHTHWTNMSTTKQQLGYYAQKS